MENRINAKHLAVTLNMPQNLINKKIKNSLIFLPLQYNRVNLKSQAEVQGYNNNNYHCNNNSHNKIKKKL